MTDHAAARLDAYWDRITAHLAGLGTPDERAETEAWLAGDVEARVVFEQARQLFGAAAPAPLPSVDLPQMWDEQVRRMAQPTPPVPQASRTPRPSGVRRTSMHLVLTFGTGLVLAALAFFAVGLGRRSAGVAASQTAAAPMREYRTQPGQRASITLADGTRVLLNVASRLRVPESFGRGTRAVVLEGEAQFDVTHDPARPFVVHANGTLVRDLATTFVVRSYQGATTRVAVRSGRVAVEPATLTASNAVTVNAGQMVSLASDGRPTLSALAEGTAFGWTRGQLVLRRVALGDALLELHRWYGVDVRAADRRLLALDVNIVLPDTLDLDKLRGMAESLGARLERTGTGATAVLTLVPAS